MPRPVSRPASSRVLLTSLLLAAASTLCAQTDTKSYRLFVGVDLLVPEQAGAKPLAPRPVASLRPHAVVLDDATHSVLPLREVPTFSWERTPKVSRAPITISNLESERTHTIQNDPAMQWMASQNNMTAYAQERHAYLQMEAAVAERTSAVTGRNNQIYAANERLAGRQLSGNASGPQGQGQAGITQLATSAEADEAWAAFNANTDGLDAALDNTVFAHKIQGATAEDGQATVLELAFDLTSAEPVADAYVVIMGLVEQPSAEGEGTVVFHQNIGAIGPETRRIKIRKVGFEPGFKIRNVVVHVFTHGRELGTNLSEKSVALTRDEAREFLLLSHISQHAIDSLSPTPVWELAPSNLLAATNPATFDHPVVVSVDADGSVISIHQSEADARAFLAEIQDAADLRSKSTPTAKSGNSLSNSVRIVDQDAGVRLDQTGRLPAPVVAAMRELIFLPALDLGTPVPGIARINLADFFR